MAEYIKREDALTLLSCFSETDTLGHTPLQIVEHLPTADVVEVVRCKDCKHRRKITWANGTDNWECVNDSGDPYEQSRHAEEDDWFCADGEAK